MSDVENAIDDKDRVIYTDSDMKSSEDEANYAAHNIRDRQTKIFKSSGDFQRISVR